MHMLVQLAFASCRCRDSHTGAGAGFWALMHFAPPECLHSHIDPPVYACPPTLRGRYRAHQDRGGDAEFTHDMSSFSNAV